MKNPINNERYARHLSLNEIGLQGQKRLQNSKVLCIGAGGLGATVLYYLAAAGVGTIGIVDADRVELSNLQRQILFGMDNVDQLKVEAAAERLLSLNPEIQICSYPVRFTKDNALAIAADYDLLIDATDNFASRYLINDLCHHLQKPDVYAGISRFKGQLAIFGPKGAPCYRCLFPEVLKQEKIANCSEAGVLGVLPGLLGCMQASEAIKLLLNIGKPLLGKVISFDALTSSWTEQRFSVNPDCPLCQNRENFDSIKRPELYCERQTMKPVISIQEFKALREKGIEHFLLDVREPIEYEEVNIQGHLIPLNQLASRLTELNPEDDIIVHCKAGMRSEAAVSLLLANGFSKVRNLEGGILAYLNDCTV